MKQKQDEKLPEQGKLKVYFGYDLLTREGLEWTPLLDVYDDDGNGAGLVGPDNPLVYKFMPWQDHIYQITVSVELVSRPDKPLWYGPTPSDKIVEVPE